VDRGIHIFEAIRFMFGSEPEDKSGIGGFSSIGLSLNFQLQQTSLF